MIAGVCWHVWVESPAIVISNLIFMICDPQRSQNEITKQDFKALQLSEKLSLEKPFDLASRGFGYSQFHQLPVSSVLVAINGVSVTSSADITAAIAEQTQLVCRFRLPKQPPTLPDFIVMRCDAYQQRGGPNILGIAGLSET